MTYVCVTHVPNIRIIFILNIPHDTTVESWLGFREDIRKQNNKQLRSHSHSLLFFPLKHEHGNLKVHYILVGIVVVV